MKLSKKIQEKISEALIIRTNELYHDFENQYYNQRHQNLFLQEEKRWKIFFEKYIKSEKPLNCLDFGTGTGLVSQIIAPKLKISDKLICADLSQEILNVCRNSLQEKNVVCEVEFVKIDGKNVPIQPNSLDIIMLNAVLHHIFDVNNFFENCANLLKNNGLLIIAHEPNQNTNLPFFYKLLLKFLETIISPSSLILYIVENQPFIESLLRNILTKISPSYKYRNEFLEKIANILIKEKYLDFKLRGTEIQQIVDIQTEKGFSKENLQRFFAKNFSILEWQTSNFTFASQKLDSFLQEKFSENGKTLHFVLKKN